jgi:hypothetical protein
MTVVCFAQAAHRLGIDTKTLHRWLSDAQLPLLSHPRDARKKGVSQEHLHELARLHQRSLTPLLEEPAVSLSSQGPEFSGVLLALPERLDSLQGQIAASQQQVAALTGLFQQHEPAPAPPAAPSQPGRAKKPPSQAARARPTATAPRKPTDVIARVEYVSEGHYVVISPKKGRLPFEPETEEWFAWVREQESFRFVGKCGFFSAHHEWRIPKGAWRAYRKIRNHNYILRLAPNHELTIAVLEQAAEALQAHLT